jgi:predicted transcriptional regulator
MMKAWFMPQSQFPAAGRPLKFGEPLVRREFKLPETLNRQLTETAQKRGRDVSDVVRDALRAEIGGGQDVQAAVRQAMAEAIHAGLMLQLTEEEKNLLALRATEMGTSPISLLEDLVRCVIGKPIEETRNYMLGDILAKSKTAA